MAVASHYQRDLSLPLILLYTTLITGVWLYLWFGGQRLMRTRRWQTYWQFIGYSTLWILGAIGMYREQLTDIFTHIHTVWHHPPASAVTTFLYFELEIAWYLSSLFCLLINTDTKDFYAMFIHHIITPVEIFYSYDCQYAAIGLVIMFLHDTSDLFLHIAKTFHTHRWKRLTDGTFLLFAITFFITRLVLLPMCPYAYFTGDEDHHSFCGHVLAGTCSLLVLLHVYWFYLIVMMMIRFALVGEVEGDIREKEVEEQHKQQRDRRRVQPMNNSQEKMNGNGQGHTQNSNGQHVSKEKKGD